MAIDNRAALGVAYVNVRVSRRLNEKQAWFIDKLMASGY